MEPDFRTLNQAIDAMLLRSYEHKDRPKKRIRLPDSVRRSGIYAIINCENGEFYVGSTKCFRERWKHHISALRGGKGSPKLQRAWNKYGEHSFEFRILEEVDDVSLLIAREQYWLDHYNPHYNSSPTAGSTYGMLYSWYKTEEDPERKRRLSQRLCIRCPGGDVLKAVRGSLLCGLCAEALNRYWEQVKINKANQRAARKALTP